jgi:aminoglycoside-2''-adenylyltransferase
MTAESFDPLRILRALNQHEVEYVVVGGFAVASHGVVRATEDLDLVVDRGLPNAERLAAALAGLGAHESAGGVPVSPEALVRSVDLTFKTVAGAVHLLREVAGIPRYGALSRERVSVEGVEFERPTLEALRAMKRAAGRDKDLVDLAELDELERE